MERGMSRTLRLAALYNIIWGSFVVAFPGAVFSLLGMAQPNYPALWQCIGMIVGVYGAGYAIASFSPLRHWPIILVGLLGKIFGPIGFLYAYAAGQLPLSFGLLLVFNDAIWWYPFARILRIAYNSGSSENAGASTAVGEHTRNRRESSPGLLGNMQESL